MYLVYYGITLFNILSLLFGATVSLTSPTIFSGEVARADWVTQEGARFVVDTRENVGYLINPDGSYMKENTGDGQPKKGCYIGKCYDFRTPSQAWTVKQLNKQYDVATFGKIGKKGYNFMRLYVDNGKTRTSYGIHPTGNIKEILAKPVEDRDVSYGCVLVSYEFLDILIDAYKLNDNSLEVVTVDGLQELVFASAN